MKKPRPFTKEVPTKLDPRDIYFANRGILNFHGWLRILVEVEDGSGLWLNKGGLEGVHCNIHIRTLPMSSC